MPVLPFLCTDGRWGTGFVSQTWHKVGTPAVGRAYTVIYEGFNLL